MASAPPLVGTDFATIKQEGLLAVAKPSSSAGDDGKAKISNALKQGQSIAESAKRPAAFDTSKLLAQEKKSGKVYHRAAVKMSLKKHSEMPNKKRRINEDQQQRRIRTTCFEPQSIRNVSVEVLNRDIGFLPRDQGILGGGPASQLRDRGIIEGRPLAQLRDHAVAGSGWPTYQTREQGIVEAGFASLLREQGVPSGRWLTSEPRIVPGWPAGQVGQQGLLGRAPSAHISSERMLPLQPPGGGRGVDQDQFSNLGGSLPGEPGILGGGPLLQLRETGMLTAAQLREQGLLGRWPSSSPVGSEGIPAFQTIRDGRIMDRNVNAAELTFNAHSHGIFRDQEQYQSVGARKLTFQALNKQRHLHQKQYTSVSVPDLAHQVRQNGAYVDQEHYKSVNTPVLPLQVFHNGRHVVPVPNSWEYDRGMRTFA